MGGHHTSQRLLEADNLHMRADFKGTPQPFVLNEASQARIGFDYYVGTESAWVE
jgi:hypothetical protein